MPAWGQPFAVAISPLSGVLVTDVQAQPGTGIQWTFNSSLTGYTPTPPELEVDLGSGYESPTGTVLAIGNVITASYASPIVAIHPFRILAQLTGTTFLAGPLQIPQSGTTHL